MLFREVLRYGFMAVVLTGLCQSVQAQEYCKLPKDVDGCCYAAVESSEIVSKHVEIVDPGVETSWITQEYICANCPQPACCECRPPDVRNCNAGAAVTITISATATINAELTVSAKSAVELALGSALGMTIGTSMTLSADCPMPTPGCAIKAGRVEVREVIGRKARVGTRWHMAKPLMAMPYLRNRGLPVDDDMPHRGIHR